MNELVVYNPDRDVKNDNERVIQTDTTFSYDGYQVVRGEFFAHLFEPSVTLSREKVSVNSACLRKLPEVDYVQFLVNPTEKKLAVKPCSEEMKDSFKWTSGEGKKRKPKVISCRIFFAKIMQLMNWDPKYRYKILGKLIRTKTDLLFVFDLKSAETYGIKTDTNEKSTRSAYYPEEWKNQFGLPVSEHQDTIKVNIFDDYAVFKISREEESRAKEKIDDVNRSASSIVIGSEKETDQGPQTDTAPVKRPGIYTDFSESDK